MSEESQRLIAVEIIYCVIELLQCSDEELEYMECISDEEFWERYKGTEN